MKVYFSDWFEVDPALIEAYGAFNVSLINDLPLFIDPFLLFTSQQPEFQRLHDQIIDYLKFLRDRSVAGEVNEGLLRAWYMFPEVKQLWLGFSLRGNGGSGLGDDFARALNDNLHVIFTNFGQEQITRGSHLEKVCLVSDGVGKDKISDFTANLIKEFLLEYTQTFARQNVPPHLRRAVSVPGVRFDYDKRVWCPGTYELPYITNGHPFIDHDFVLLTPKAILTKDETWINRHELMDRFPSIASSVHDLQLRSQVSEYLTRCLSKRPTRDEKLAAYSSLLREYPALIEWYIKHKEDTGGQAVSLSNERVASTEDLFIRQLGELIQKLDSETTFYNQDPNTFDECRSRIMFLKHEIEHRDAYRIFYVDGKPIKREHDVHVLFQLTWRATKSDFNREVNNGRGPVDAKVSRGDKDKTLVEFKLASNTKLRHGLEKQVPIYEAANRTRNSFKVILFFSADELAKVEAILKDLKLENDDTIILIDCRNDNKPSASNG